MKWGTKYGPEYVNRLYAMVRRNLSGDFKFVCLTDDGAGIRPEVTCLPIPPLNLQLAPGQRDGAWKKLTTFEKTCTACAAPPCSWMWTWSSSAASMPSSNTPANS